MGKKYIIELEDENYHQYSDSEPSDYLWRVKGFNALVFDEVGISKLTPYTEPDLEQIKADWYKAGREAERVRQPDLEQVRKEAYDKCMDEAEMLAYKLYSPKIDAAYQRGLADGKNQDAKDFADMYDSGYDEGLKDAWEAARKIQDTGGNLNWWIHNVSASEAIKRIRQHEQEREERIDPDKSKVEALANDIGIHKLFALVKEIRGE